MVASQLGAQMPSEWDSAQGRVFLWRRVGIGPCESSTVLPWAVGRPLSQGSRPMGGWDC